MTKPEQQSKTFNQDSSALSGIQLVPARAARPEEKIPLKPARKRNPPVSTALLEKIIRSVQKL